MSFIPVIEEAICRRLNAVVNPEGVKNAAVELYPDKPGEYKFTHVNSALLVRYVGSKTKEIHGGGLSRIEAVFEVSILTRNYNNVGTLIGQVRDALRWFDPLEEARAKSQCRLILTSDGFADYETGRWRHYVRASIELFDPLEGL